ncbi:MAG: circadian clock protein KaiC, partial [Proteobacteria bacterium]
FIQGGLPRRRVYLVEGDPGVGKTTFSLQFLLEGAKSNEKVLLIGLAESQDELMAVGQSHGWDLSAIEIFELAPSETLDQEEQYSILEPSEMELGDTVKRIFEVVDRLKPDRVVFDSLSEMRLLAQSPLRYRRQILALKHHFVSRNCTVLFLDDRSSDSRDLTLQSLVHGVIELQKYSPIYGKARRKLQVTKLRGVRFQAGYHDFEIETGGIVVFPRLPIADHSIKFEPHRFSCGVESLDTLLGGGLDRGTTTLIMGPAGCGKSSLAALYAVKSAELGHKSVIFTFDEGLATLKKRTKELGMDVQPHIDEGRIHLQQVDPAEMSPGEFMWRVRETVERMSATVVIIDSLTGYIDAMPESQFLSIQMHEMLAYLNQRGVLTIMTMAQHGYLGSNLTTPADISYLADTVVLLRFFEVEGAVKKAISVIKKRSGTHESTVREYKLGPVRIQVGRALTEFHGVLSGALVYSGHSS